MEWEILITRPSEGRPLVDSITASRIANMKELRPPIGWAERDQDLAGVRPVEIGDFACGGG